MFELFVQSLHTFFSFLASSEGILFRLAIETLILAGTLYMAFSEYLRTRSKQMLWFVITFSIFAALRAILVAIVFLRIFGGQTFNFMQSLFPLVEQTISLLGILALLRALLYFDKRKLPFTEVLAGGILSVGVILYFFWESARWIIEYNVFWGRIPFFGIELILLALCIIAVISSKNSLIKAYFIALLFFSLAPIFGLINYLFFGGHHIQLQAITTPMNTIAIILFARAMYLTLANKITLFRELHTSKQKYETEKELSKLKDAFVSTISHELRTPLTTIKLYNDLLKDGEFGTLTGEQKDTTKTISTEVDRLANLINDLLDFSKFSAGKILLQIEEFDISELLRNSPHNALAGEKNIRLEFDMPLSFKYRGDEDRVHQLYINLLANAIKFSGEQTQITIRLRPLMDGVMLKIIDQGCGIPKEKQEHLFEPFYQAHTGKGGTGLGLAICKHIAQLHGGDIGVESEERKGTVVIVTLKNATRHTS